MFCSTIIRVMIVICRRNFCTGHTVDIRQRDVWLRAVWLADWLSLQVIGFLQQFFARQSANWAERSRDHTTNKDIHNTHFKLLFVVCFATILRSTVSNSQRTEQKEFETFSSFKLNRKIIYLPW